MCYKCGNCCKANSFNHDRVDIQFTDIEKWKEIGIWKDIRKKLETTSENESGYIISLDEKSCPFLNRENLCILHKKYGYYAKPKVCREFKCGEI